MAFYILVESPHLIQTHGPDLEPGTLCRSHSSDVHEESDVLDVVLLEYVANDSARRMQTTYVPVPMQCLRELDEEKLGLLEAIAKPKQRLKVFDHPDWIDDGRKLSASDKVQVFFKRDPKLAVGTLRYKGPLKGEPGTKFGIELGQEYRGFGATDGEFRKVRYFTCGEDCGLFLSLDRVRAYDTMKIENAKAELINSLPIKVNDRVVWLSDSGPERGTVRWLGFLPLDAHDNTISLKDREITAGVEFDHPIGRGTGRFKNQQLFHARRKHASLVPVLGLLKETEYLELPEFHLSSGSDDGKSLVTDGPEDTESGDMSLHCQAPSLRSTSVATVWESDEETIDYNHLDVGSFVKVQLLKVCFGIIRWKSSDEGQSHSGKVMVGLEMDEEDQDCYTNGTFLKQRLFLCQDYKAFFVYVNKCRPNNDLERLYGKKCSPEVCGSVVPVKGGKNILGNYSGIQGHKNSSFMDSILMAVFFTTNTLYDIVLSASLVNGKGQAVKEALIEKVVNPLRQYHYVRADRILQLRVLIQDACQSMKVELPDLSSHGNDPEVVLNCLFRAVFNIKGLLLLSTEEKNLEKGEENREFVCHVSLDTLPAEGLTLQGVPGIGDLLQLMAFQSALRFVEAPEVLIVKVHRTLPTEAIYLDPVLDVTDLVKNVARECIVCGDLARHECRECFSESQPSLQNVTFCTECYERAHLRSEKKKKHRPMGVETSGASGSAQSDSLARITMSMSAVICKQDDDHFVTFLKVKLGNESQWICYDGQAAKSTEASGHFISRIWACPGIAEWTVSTAKAKLWGKTDFHPDVHNFLFNSYLCLYEKAT